ncbi:MAG: glycoside hydrolase family 1 protein [Candidatus Veblenbacteria bacterium]|nr:glycoside hydrolase family 1 protein [Candidatus Veblenbacteria bacterium]MDZ4229511.1 glycoside hydrolase family 1 protein [Candidatus Veblenbacteria bacterium]
MPGPARFGGGEPSFWWGAATSSYQVEGGNVWSDWYEWEHRQGLEQCGQAVQHYERFAEDFRLAKSLGQNAHRLSLEWGRLEPEAGNWSEEAIAHYHQVFNSLRECGLKICLTLNHFTLPTWLARQGGWECAQAVPYFERYVRRVVTEFGDQVDLWLTINEPLVLATEAYLYGHWPPAVRSRQRMRKVVERLSEAHRAAYRIIHELLSQAQVGLAHNFLSLAPLRVRFVLDQWAAERADWFWNRWLMNLTAGCHDFIGLNYYFHQRARLSLNPRRGWVSFADPKKLGHEVSALGWEVYPEGLDDLLRFSWQRYGLPLYVTENGIAPVSEAQRTNFLERSLAALLRVKEQGVDVRGYFYWSLMDNFEWDKGFSPRFGLVAVDRQSFVRTPRPAAEVYATYCGRDKLKRAGLEV